MTETQRENIVMDLRAMAMQMEYTAREMVALGGRCAVKAIELGGASTLARSWADAIEGGDE